MNNMKKKIDSAKIKRFLASFFIYLMVFSPFSIGQGESGAAVNQETNLPTEFPAENIQDVFENNPTPENFNKLPNPTAADLELVQNPTPENFNHLDSSEQGTYLSNEDNFRQDFAGEYYSDPANWGANPEADKILFAGTRFRDLLKAGTSQVSAAEQYFSDNFGAPYTLAIVADDFIFDQENRILKNGKTNLKLDDYTGDSTITEIKATADGFEISRKAEENEQVISVSGEEEKSVSYDSEKGTFAFQLPEGKPHTFNVPAVAKVKFAFDKDKITITGPASGIFESANDYVQFDNHAGILVINDNGNIEAENAEVITSLLYMDGRFVKTGSQIKALGRRKRRQTNHSRRQKFLPGRRRLHRRVNIRYNGMKGFLRPKIKTGRHS